MSELDKEALAQTLGASEVIPLPESCCGNDIMSMLAAREWYDERQKALKNKDGDTSNE